MRILLDECLPRRLRTLLARHESMTAPDMGWAGKGNGELLRLAEGRFDVFLTSDRNLAFQQNVSGLQIAVIVLAARSNRFDALEPLMPKVLASLQQIRPGDVITVPS